MTRQQAAAQGLPPSYAGNQTGGITQQSQQQPSFLQNLLGGLRGWGGGAIQDIAAPANLAYQEITHGQSPIAGVGNQPNINQLNAYAQSNHFATKQQLQQMGGSVPQAATQVAKDTAGAASWLMPMSAGGALARGALGATQGALNGVSQDGANPTSVGTNMVTSAGMNMVNPLIAKGLQSMYGRMVLGPGGSKFGDIVRAVNDANQPTNKWKAALNYLNPGQFGDNAIVGTGKGIASKLKNATIPINDDGTGNINSIGTQFNDILANLKGGIKKSDIFGSRTVSGQRDPANPGLVGNLIDNLGYSAQGPAEDYAKTLEKKLQDLHINYLTSAGHTAVQALNMAQNDNVTVPYSVMQNFIRGVGKDTKVWNNPGIGDMAQGIYGNIRNQIAQATRNPAEYNKLQGLKQAAMDMEETLNNHSAGSKFQKKFQSMAERHGIGGVLGTGGVAAAMLGHPMALLPGGIALASSFPEVASRGISFANSPLGKLLGVASRKSIANTVGDSQTTSQ